MAVEAHVWPHLATNPDLLKTIALKAVSLRPHRENDEDGPIQAVEFLLENALFMDEVEALSFFDQTLETEEKAREDMFLKSLQKAAERVVVETALAERKDKPLH